MSDNPELGLFGFASSTFHCHMPQVSHYLTTHVLPPPHVFSVSEQGKRVTLHVKAHKDLPSAIMFLVLFSPPCFSTQQFFDTIQWALGWVFDVGRGHNLVTLKLEMVKSILLRPRIGCKTEENRDGFQDMSVCGRIWWKNITALHY